MSMGDVNNNQNRRSLEDTFYSRTRITSNNMVIGFSFWKGMLKVSISEREQGSNGQASYNDIGYIHLSPTKARVLKMEIEAFLKDPSLPRGVNTGTSETQGVIAISAREDSTPEAPKYYLIIGKVNPSGIFVERCEFDFNFNYHYGLVFDKIDDSVSFNKEYFDDLEIKQLLSMLDEYCWSSNGASGYFSSDISRYENARRENKIDDIVASMGIERKSSRQNNNGGGYNKSVFSDNRAGQTRVADNKPAAGRSGSFKIEDMENDMLD